MRGIARTLLLVIAALSVLPGAVFAQGSLTGMVKDASEAVLPGITVEAASPALIEKIRTATTNSSGQSRIVDLRPGSYIVTLTLTGFNSVRREGVELTGSNTVLVNADMPLGPLEETITAAR